MEFEGLGISLVGRCTWVVRSKESPLVPWEFLHASNYALRILIRSAEVTPTEIEQPWTCVWIPTCGRDWSCIATALRSATGGPCLLVLEDVMPPPTFWTYVEGLQREGRSLTRVWVHREAPPCVPDATFFGPVAADSPEADHMLRVFEAMPARGAHGRWDATRLNWGDLVAATHEQGLGLVLTDMEEQAWTVLWHRVEDSRGPLEKRTSAAKAWIQAGVRVLAD
jgi:hypothetical protein